MSAVIAHGRAFSQWYLDVDDGDFDLDASAKIEVQ
jgi:hypothetical protein